MNHYVTSELLELLLLCDKQAAWVVVTMWQERAAWVVVIMWQAGCLSWSHRYFSSCGTVLERLKVKPPTTLTFICQPIKSETQGKSIVFPLSLQFPPLDPVNSMNQFVILNTRVSHDNLKCTNIRKTLDSTFAICYVCLTHDASW